MQGCLVDPGDLGFFLNIVALIIVFFGVLIRNRSDNSMIWHGYLSLLGFALKLTTVFFTMVPSLIIEPLDTASLSQLGYWLVLSKVSLGVIGTFLGFICIVPWFLKPLKEMACEKVWRLMMPTMILWVAAVLLGAVVHFGEFF